MTRPRFDVADVVGRFGSAFLEAFGASVSALQRHVLNAIAACRTAVLGGHLSVCDECGTEVISYNSCRSRHCPKCLASRSADWLEARQQELLPVPYFHVVFTLPHQLEGIALQNKRVVYDILFAAAAQTLQQIAGDPKHLGAQIGFLAILHTWGQNLLHHPHVHCVVPAGGLSTDRSRWIPCRVRGRFFLPVRVLSAVFRGKFLEFLRTAFDGGRLGLHGSLSHLADPQAFDALLRSTRTKDWVVYAKRPFGGPEQVLKYLARYTHRVAIANSRLVSIDDTHVSFLWKDYAKGNRRRTMKLEGPEFIRRFLLHVLPKGFVRIRHFGFLANRVRTASLARCRELLPVPTSPAAVADVRLTAGATTDHSLPRCPTCGKGHLIPVATLPPMSDRSPFTIRHITEPDTS